VLALVSNQVQLLWEMSGGVMDTCGKPGALTALLGEACQYVHLLKQDWNPKSRN